MNEAVNGTINQISSSSIEWWSSFVCSLHVALFHEGFCLVVGGVAGWVNSGPFPLPPHPPHETTGGLLFWGYPWAAVQPASSLTNNWTKALTQ